jgi:hypothetical protein
MQGSFLGSATKEKLAAKKSKLPNKLNRTASSRRRLFDSVRQAGGIHGGRKFRRSQIASRASQLR